jgi:hypothetical protein
VNAAPPPTPPAEAAGPVATPNREADASEDLAADACPLCSAPLHDDQDWCVRCGAAARTRLASPPAWRWPLLAFALLVVLCAIALTASLVKLSGGSGTTTITGAPVTAAAPATPPAAATTGATGATAPAAGATGPTAPPATTTPVPGTGTTAPGAARASGGATAPGG